MSHRRWWPTFLEGLVALVVALGAAIAIGVIAEGASSDGGDDTAFFTALVIIAVAVFAWLVSRGVHPLTALVVAVLLGACAAVVALFAFLAVCDGCLA